MIYCQYWVFTLLTGCWDDDVMEVILQFLVIGNSDIRSDLIHTMAEGKNLQYVDKVSNMHRFDSIMPKRDPILWYDGIVYDILQYMRLHKVSPILQSLEG